MSFLLTLPRELRDQIIDLVVSTSVAIPLNAKHRPVSSNSWVLDSTACHQPNALALLLTNKQLNSETKQSLSRTKPVLTLDLAIVDRYVYQTWRIIPPKTQTLMETFHVNIILSHSDVVSVRTSSPGWISERDHIWHSVLGFLISEAPADDKAVHSLPNISIEQLKLNIDTSPYRGGRHTLGEDAIPVRADPRSIHLSPSFYPVDVATSEECIDRLREELDQKTWNPATAYKGFEILITNVRKIAFCLDGVLKKESDMLESVVELPVARAATNPGLR